MIKYLFFILITGIYTTAWSQAPQPKAPLQKANEPAPVVQAPTEAAAVAPQTPTDPLAGIIEDYTYSPAGKRDPFLPMETGSSDMSLGPIFELQKFDLDQLLVSGIIWNVKAPKAMILDPAGKSHVIGMNDRIGRNNGYVARIREGEVVVIESFRSQTGKVSYQTRMLRISKD